MLSDVFIGTYSVNCCCGSGKRSLTCLLAHTVWTVAVVLLSTVFCASSFGKEMDWVSCPLDSGSKWLILVRLVCMHLWVVCVILGVLIVLLVNILSCFFISKSEKSKDASLNPDALGEFSSLLCWWRVTRVFVVFHFPVSWRCWCDWCCFRIYHPKKTGPTRKELSNAATLIQRHIRGWLVRRRFDKLHRKVQHIARQLCSIQCTAASCPLAVRNVQLCSMQCSAALFHAGQCSTVSYDAMQHCSIKYSMFHTVQCKTVLYSAALFHTMQCRTVPYSALQHIPCNAVQLCSIQFNATVFHTMQHCSIQFSATVFHTMQQCSIQFSNTVPYSATLFQSIQCNTAPYSATLLHTVQHCSMQFNATLFHAMQHCSIQFNAALFHTVQCSTVPYSAMQHCSIQCNATLFCAVQ